MNFVFLLPSIVEYVKYFFIRPYRFVIKIASYFVCVKLKKKEKKKYKSSLYFLRVLKISRKINLSELDIILQRHKKYRDVIEYILRKFGEE